MQQPRDNINQLFRSKMDGLEISPPEGAWSNIQSAVTGLKTNSPTKSGFFNRKTYLAGISLMVVITAIFLLYYPEKKESQIDASFTGQTSKPLVEKDQLLQESNYTLPPDVNALYTNAGFERSNMISGNKNTMSASPPLTDQYKKGSPGYSEQAVDRFDEFSPVNKTGSKVPPASEVLENIISLQLKYNDKNENRTVQIPDIAEELILAETEVNTIENKENQPVAQTRQKNAQTVGGTPIKSPPPANDYGIRDRWAAGIHFTPDWIVYPLLPDKKHRGYTVELNIYRQWKDFHIQTGLGISVMNDLGSFVVDYSKWDVTGAYQHVDSLSFDTSGGHVAPIFWTSTVKLYDSVDNQDNKNTNNRYTYFQLPLLVAYKLIEYKRFSAYINGGPVLSILMHKKEPALEISNGDISIIKITNDTPLRFNTNIQLWGSFEFGYAVTSRFRLTLEPLIKYYISPVYDKESSTIKNPYSTGLRLGLKWSL